MTPEPVRSDLLRGFCSGAGKPGAASVVSEALCLPLGILGGIGNNASLSCSEQPCVAWNT